MLKIFSLPIWIGIALGALFPYRSLALIWASSFLLFALLFINTLPYSERKSISMRGRV